MLIVKENRFIECRSYGTAALYGVGDLRCCLAQFYVGLCCAAIQGPVLGILRPFNWENVLCVEDYRQRLQIICGGHGQLTALLQDARSRRDA